MREGDLVAARFLLLAHAASGGMGTVFRALDTASERRVAVKTCALGVPPASATDGGPRARFELEAAALAELTDPGVVGYVAHGTSDTGEPFLVMDWVEGESLSERLSREGLSVLDSLLLTKDLARALSVIHARGIVHRDLKPSNVMLREGDIRRAVLVDFGVARRAESASVTLSGARVGTLLYMAPEQIRDARRVDGRSDVFALGCVLFECLTGARAFDADDALATIAQILLDEPPDPLRFRPDLPAEVASLVRRMMARERDARPPARELERELGALLSRCRGLELGPPDPGLARERAAPEVAATAAAVSLADSRPAELRTTDAGLAESQARIRQIVARPNRFIGRDAELGHLQGLIASGANLLVIWGPAGIGKTRLCLELSRRGGARKLDVVDFVDLGQARDVDDAIRIVARATGASVRGGDRPEQIIGRSLGRLGECVFVLDRVEHLAQELGPVLDLWRRAAPQACFVVTSRERTRWAGAVFVELGPLPTRGAQAEPSPAAQLLLERMRASDGSFAAHAALERGLEAIASALQGIPLAIELAAARVSLLGLEGVAARVSTQLELLGNAAPAESDGQMSMRAAIRASVELLTEPERRAFAQCAVFSGPFTVDAAEAVLDPPEAGSVLDLLQSLRDKSLLAALGDSDVCQRPRLFSFSVIREYALAELDARGEEHALRARHGSYYVKRAVALGRSPSSSEPWRRVAEIEADSDNLIAAIHHALSGRRRDVSLALDALLALEPVISARGPLPSFVQLVDTAIDCGDAMGDELFGDPRLVRLRLLRARVAATAGRFARAREDLGRVLQEARRAPERAGRDRRLEAAALLELGVVQHLERSLDEAQASYEQALAAFASRSEPELEGRCYGNLGALLHDRGRLTEAAAYYWRAIHVLEDAGERRMRGNFLGNLGVLEHELQALERARRHYQQALALLSAVGDARLRAITLGNLGVLEQDAGAWEAALRCHEEALELFEPLDDASSEALCLARLGATLAMLARCEEAEERLDAAARLLRDSDPIRAEAVRLQRGFLDLALARRSADALDLGEARARLERARERCRRAEEPRGGAPAPIDESDDVRVTLRILKRHVTFLERELGDAAASSHR